MTDEIDRFDHLLGDAVRGYNEPPSERQIPLEDIWRSVEAQAFPGTRRPRRYTHWLGIAAALIVGIGLGRLSFLVGGKSAPRAIASTGAQAVAPKRQAGVAEALPSSVDPTTSRYLDQAAALLIALPSEASLGRPDQPFVKRANDLLLTTRLLLDSPSGSDPAMHTLLEDLELVLVQVVRLEKERAPSRSTELELIQQALDQRDVIPRLRTAASEYATDD
jgi:hypothetical protein